LSTGLPIVGPAMLGQLSRVLGPVLHVTLRKERERAGEGFSQ
jgi:hypothetical protein